MAMEKLMKDVGEESYQDTIKGKYYPSISVDADDLKLEDNEVGDKIEIHGIAKIVGVNEENNNGKKEKKVRLEIHKLMCHNDKHNDKYEEHPSNRTLKTKY